MAKHCKLIRPLKISEVETVTGKVVVHDGTHLIFVDSADVANYTELPLSGDLSLTNVYFKDDDAVSIPALEAYILQPMHDVHDHYQAIRGSLVMPDSGDYCVKMEDLHDLTPDKVYRLLTTGNAARASSSRGIERLRQDGMVKVNITGASETGTNIEIASA